MVTVYIDDYYHKYTCNTAALPVKADTVADALKYICGTYPQLMVFLLNNNKAEAKKLALILNDEEFLELADNAKKLQYGDTLHIMCAIPLGESSLVSWVADGISWALSGVEALSSLSTSTLDVIGYTVAIVAAMGVQMALSYVIGMLTDSTAEPTVSSGSLNNSATYTFNGIFNTTAAGTSLQVVYGKARTGGHIVSLFLSNTVVPPTGLWLAELDYNTVNYQIALCEGEIEDVSDIQIDKLPASTYAGVSIYPDVPDYLRKGTADQEIMTEFSEIRDTISISRLIRNLADDITATGTAISDYYPVYGTVVVNPLFIYPIATLDTQKLTYVND